MVMQKLKRLSAFIDYRRKGNEALSDQFVNISAVAAFQGRSEPFISHVINYLSLIWRRRR